MRALTLVADRKLELADLPAPATPASGEVQIKIRAVALNHLDLWGYRGMAFARRKLPLVVGAEAAGEIAAIGPETAAFKPGDRVVMYGALTCGACKACREGRDNLCENVGGIMGFHLDGIGSVAIKMAKAIGCTVITTVGDDAKAEKAKALGADHVVNYRTDRFEGAVRKITAKKGVDVVFEHVGAETFNGSLLCLKRGGRLVTCGSTSGPSTTINLMQLFQQQYRIIGSFGASMRNIRESLAKMANGLLPVIDTEVPLADFERGLTRLESRQVFGKIVVTF